ncbi:MAG: MBL fold metallo-hydrolase [Bacteroidales bacterium]|nr:MBL fold metallo-hydrolase [Bacteroidales bacterium]
MKRDKSRQWTTRNGYRIIQLLSGRSNVFLVSHEDKNIVIDTSPGRKWKKLNNRIKSLNIKHIDYIILTHTHFDHAANAARLKREYRASVMVHQSEASYLRVGDNPMISGTNIFTWFMVKCFVRGFMKRLKYEPCEPDIEVGTGLDLSESGFNTVIMHTPGHTKGSMSVIIDDEFALVGDAMFGVFP